MKIIEASNQMKVNIAFSGLSGNTTVAHIHGPTATAGTGTASVMTTTPSFPGFPAGVKSGSYEQTFDLLATSTYRAGFITANGGTAAGARDAFLLALLDGKAYLNVHSSTYPGGEIRGQSVHKPHSRPARRTWTTLAHWPDKVHHCRTRPSAAPAGRQPLKVADGR